MDGNDGRYSRYYCRAIVVYIVLGGDASEEDGGERGKLLKESLWQRLGNRRFV